MKNFLFTLLVAISGSALAAPMYGQLTAVSEGDGIVSYRCQLEGGKGYTIALSHNTDGKTISVELGGMLAYPQDATVKLNGPYAEVEVAEANKPMVKHYELNAAAYHLDLAFSAGKPLPVLTLAYGARPFICR